MSDDDKKAGGKAESSDEGFKMFAWAAGAAAALFLSPCVLVGAGLWYGTRKYLARLHYAMLFAVGLAGWALNAHAWGPQYNHWVFFWWNHSPFWAVPVVPVLFGGLAAGALVGVLAGTKAAGVLPLILGKDTKEPIFDEVTSLVPSDEEKQVARALKPEGGVLAPDREHRNVLSVTDVPNKGFIPLGYDGNRQPVGVLVDELRMHMVILGGTGSGKSESIKQLAAGMMDLGMHGLILDLKEDTKPGGLRDWCKDYAAHHILPYQHLGLSDRNPDFWFNPLADIGPDEARDSILSTVQFDDQYHQSLNRKMLGHALNLMFAAHKADPEKYPYPSTYELGKLLEQGAQVKNASKEMRAAVKIAGLEDEAGDFSMMANPTQDAATDGASFGLRLTNIYDTLAGRTVLRPGNGKRLLDVTAPGLTYIGLDSNGKPDLTGLVSATVLQRMNAFAAQMTQNPPAGGVQQRFLIVDEAGWVPNEPVQNLLARARSAGITVILCTQSAEDWGENWGVLTGNVNVGLIMSQSAPSGAQLASDFIGARRVTRLGKQYKDGEVVDSSSILDEVVPYVEPHQLRSMSIGDAILRVGKPQEKVSWLSVKMRDARGGIRPS